MLTLWGPGGEQSVLRRAVAAIVPQARRAGDGGLGLPGLLQAEARARGEPGRGQAPSRGSSHKSVIMIYLAGGLAHQDTFDLKPEAPDGIRGEFKPIATRLPGVHIGEHLPRIAGLIDKVAVIRSIVGLRDEHSSFAERHRLPDGPGPARGEAQLRVGDRAASEGPVDPVVPPFIDLFPVMQHKPYNSPGPGLPRASATRPARMEGDDLALLKPPADVPPPRFDRRKALLGQFDQFRRSVDNAEIGGMDGVYRRAFDVLTSDKVARALDLSREDPRLRDRYGVGSPAPLDDAAPMCNDQFLIARRLVEAGARCVTVAYRSWDTHGGNFDRLRKQLPAVRPGGLGAGRGHPQPRPRARRDAWWPGASSAGRPRSTRPPAATTGPG